MKSIIAFSSWKNRIAPVFDVSRSVRIVEVEGRQILRQSQAGVAGEQPHLKALRLAALKVDALVCGAISTSLQAMITTHGIDIIPFVAGDLQEVMQASICGDLANAGGYTMPGCQRGHARCRKDGNAAHKEEDHMSGNKQGKKGTGAGRGCSGQGGRGRGGMGKGQNQRAGRPAAGLGATDRGFCVCPQCGNRVPHESGVRCTQQQCAQCGAIMGRQ